MAQMKRSNTIVLADEADQIFSHVTTSAIQRQELLPIWQTVKLGNFIIFIQHLGLGIDLILRYASLITIDCTFDHEEDKVNLTIRDKQYGRFIETELPHASFWYDKYDRWQSTY